MDLIHGHCACCLVPWPCPSQMALDTAMLTEVGADIEAWKDGLRSLGWSGGDLTKPQPPSHKLVGEVRTGEVHWYVDSFDLEGADVYVEATVGEPTISGAEARPMTAGLAKHMLAVFEEEYAHAVPGDLADGFRQMVAGVVASETREARLREVLGRLVSLKDGPRDSAYYERKNGAWTDARAALAGTGSTPT